VVSRSDALQLESYSWQTMTAARAGDGVSTNASSKTLQGSHSPEWGWSFLEVGAVSPSKWASMVTARQPEERLSPRVVLSNGASRVRGAVANLRAGDHG